MKKTEGIQKTLTGLGTLLLPFYSCCLICIPLTVRLIQLIGVQTMMPMAFKESVVMFYLKLIRNILGLIILNGAINKMSMASDG